MILAPPITTPIDPLCPYTTLFRSHPEFVPQALEEAALLDRLYSDQRALRDHLAVQRDLHRADFLALGDRRHQCLGHVHRRLELGVAAARQADRKSTRLNSSH